MEKKIEQLEKMIAENNPNAMDFLSEIVNEAKASGQMEKINELAAKLMVETKRSLDKVESSITEYNLRKQLGPLADAINLAYIARQYFGKSRSWLYQRIKGNIVNGKPAEFTSDEKETFNNALNDIKNQISSFIVNA